MDNLNNSSFQRETRPRIYNLGRSPTSLILGSKHQPSENTSRVDRENYPPLQGHSIRKSAEFTFSNFKQIKEADLGSEYPALAEHPYFSNKMHENISNLQASSKKCRTVCKDMPMKSHTQRTKTKSEITKQKRDRSQRKIEYEEIRSVLLDKQAERMQLESDYNRNSK